jgi:hypothetical protein
MLVPLGKTELKFPLQIVDENGQPVAPSSTPTVKNVRKNGADASESTVTIAQAQDATPANITGLYDVTVKLTGASSLGASVNDDIAITFEFSYDGSTGTAVKSFTMAKLGGSGVSARL